LVTVKKIFSSETAWQNGAKLGKKHLCKVLYKLSSCLTVANQKKRMALGGHVHLPNGTKWRNLIEDLT
jgi:hypothetical protein